MRKGPVRVDQINFIFDNSAFSHICDLRGYSSILDILHRRKDEIIIVITAINYYEYLKQMFNTRDLIQRQNYVKKVIELDVTIFPDPPMYLAYRSDAIEVNALFSHLKTIEERIVRFLEIDDFKAYENEFKNDLSAAFASLEDIRKSGITMVNQLYKCKKDNNEDFKFRNLKNSLLSDPEDDWYNGIIPNLLRRYNLLNLNGVINKKIFMTLPSLKYFSDILWRITREYVLNNKKYDVNDYFDLEPVIYLDTIDYYVSNDNRARNLINDSCNQDLRKRAISPHEFINMIKLKKVKKRAVCKAEFYDF